MDLSGNWRSRYEYKSGSRNKKFEGEHLVVFQQFDSKLAGNSKAEPGGSALKFDLRLDNGIVTGSWKERTTQKGHYKGAVFHGALQAIVSEDGRKMHGQWVGFNSNRTQIKNGNWGFSRE